MKISSLVLLMLLVSRSLTGAEDLALRKERASQQTKAIESSPSSVELFSQRGDARFILGEFVNAAADYDRMVELDAAQDAGHWRRGIAWFYAGEYEKAAGQFERYHSFDNVDRENGIWRYLCQRNYTKF